MNHTYIASTDITGKRVVATLIDYTFLFACSFGYILAFGEPNEEGGSTVSGPAAFVPVVIWFLWIVVAEAQWGQTLGHAIAGVKVISTDGRKVSFGQVLVRRLMDMVEISWCFGLVAFIVTKTQGKRQRIGDLVANTLVVPKAYQPERFDFEIADPSAILNHRHR